ncbi:uncharacterized protein METZ01_LOCUS395841 [marine metagenome]|uniref:Uncharacterized protein n=1 Tax=marine metagenome TaxID=408172 RepID=A0A382V976_9ZZZZ
MSYFAEIDRNNKVIRVVVINQETINTGKWGNPDRWIETTKYTPLRYNYAGIGYTYDEIRDAFIAPKPYSSWVLNDDTCQWNAPTPMPDDGKRYVWDEDTTSWKEIE